MADIFLDEEAHLFEALSNSSDSAYFFISNMKKNVDMLNVTSEVGVGTTVEMMVKFV